MKSTNIIITTVVLVLIGGGVYVLNDNKNDAMMKGEMMQSDKMMMEKEMMEKEAMTSTTSDTMMKKDDKMMMEKEAMMKKDDTMMVKGASYEIYSPEKLANAEAGNVVLFFRAGWCPSCRTVDADIKANMKSIPANLTILDVDYDKSSDLKKKYGVTTQHTFVQVDANGNLIKKWSGGNTLNSVVSQVK